MDTARREEILKKLSDGVVKYDEDQVKEYSQTALDEGLDALDAIMNGIAAGMKIVGDLYDKPENFISEILMCADAIYAGLSILRPHLKMDSSAGPKAQVVIGTVQGDVHDIDKNIIKLMFLEAGFIFHDLGLRRSPGKIRRRTAQNRLRNRRHVSHDDNSMMDMKKVV